MALHGEVVEVNDKIYTMKPTKAGDGNDVTHGV